MDRKKLGLAYYIGAILFYLTALIGRLGGGEGGSSTVWICLGSAFLCLGAAFSGKKETEEK